MAPVDSQQFLENVFIKVNWKIIWVTFNFKIRPQVSFFAYDKTLWQTGHLLRWYNYTWPSECAWPLLLALSFRLQTHKTSSPWSFTLSPEYLRENKFDIKVTLWRFCRKKAEIKQRFVFRYDKTSEVQRLCSWSLPLRNMANNTSLEQDQNPCSAINNTIPWIQGKLPTLTLSGKIRVTVTFFLFLLSTAFNASFLMKLQKWTQKREKGKKLSRMKVLLKHLTLANLLETLIVMPLDGMWNITVQWHAGEFLCKLLSYLKLFSMYAPAFMMVVISLDRSLAITRPLAVQNKSQLERSMIGLAWILSIVFAGPQVNRYSWTWVDMVILYLTLSQASTCCMAFKTLSLEVREKTLTLTTLSSQASFLTPLKFYWFIHIMEWLPTLHSFMIIR